MDISSYSNERILNTIKQSYNFDVEIVKAAIDQAIKKGLMSSYEIESILKKNEIERERKKNANYELDKMANMGELSTDNNGFSKWFYIMVPGIILLLSILGFFYTGRFVFLLVGPSASGFMYSRHKSKFDR